MVHTIQITKHKQMTAFAICVERAHPEHSLEETGDVVVYVLRQGGLLVVPLMQRGRLQFDGARRLGELGLPVQLLAQVYGVRRFPPPRRPRPRRLGRPRGAT